MKKNLNRSIDYRRTTYRPPSMYCPCSSCLSWRSDPALRELLQSGHPNISCKYINPEKVFADLWEKENERRPGINYGMGILQDLMVTQREPGPKDYAVADRMATFKWRRVAFVVTPRERVIVATVIQWLGTNVGWCFLSRCVEACGYRLVRRDLPD
jgi:hypothetical protein